MKKLALTVAIVLGTSIGVMAQQGGGLFQRGDMSMESTSRGDNSGSLIALPSSHNSPDDADATTPLGSGIAVLVGLGTAYVFSKKKAKK